MLTYDDTYSWEGWGGALKLASGRCRLRIFNLASDKGLEVLRPFVIIVQDDPESPMSVRSCAGHIATGVTNEFNIEPGRMLWVEYYPQKTYGINKEKSIPERFETVEFEWHDGKAIEPKWREPRPQMLKILKQLVD